MTHFACKYIGLPWVAGAQGPDEFDCWGMVRWILKHEYGIDVPAVNVNPDNLRSVLIAFKKDPAFRAFNEVEKRRRTLCHVLRRGRQLSAGLLRTDAAGNDGKAVGCCRLPLSGRDRGSGHRGASAYRFGEFL